MIDSVKREDIMIMVDIVYYYIISILYNNKTV
jgi:hypothetical protein